MSVSATSSNVKDFERTVSLYKECQLLENPSNEALSIWGEDQHYKKKPLY